MRNVTERDLETGKRRWKSEVCYLLDEGAFILVLDVLHEGLLESGFKKLNVGGFEYELVTADGEYWIRLSLKENSLLEVSLYNKWDILGRVELERKDWISLWERIRDLWEWVLRFAANKYPNNK